MTAGVTDGKCLTIEKKNAWDLEYRDTKTWPATDKYVSRMFEQVHSEADFFIQTFENVRQNLNLFV